jgi:hypothetical protein
MIEQLALRFAIGGIGVSAFAAVGQGLKPDSFAGLFGAAPSVAAVSLAFAAHEHSRAYVSAECEAMCLGAVALTLYSLACACLTRFERLPVWLAAGAGWAVWALVAADLHLGACDGAS